jgi:hypothetical protein
MLMASSSNAAPVGSAPSNGAAVWVPARVKRTATREGFFVYLRFYGPLEPFYDKTFYDKTWRPGDLTPTD